VINDWLDIADDPDFLNRVANDPSVFSWVAGPLAPPLDLRPVTDNEANLVLVGEHGFCVFAPTDDAIYEMHCAVLPEGRGRWALRAARQAITLAFRHIVRCTVIVAYIPASNRPARHLISALGFQRLRVMPTAWPIAGRLDDLHLYVLQRVHWGSTCQ
jgi:RimJ/RimL family protein N-acetyltransferase